MTYDEQWMSEHDEGITKAGEAIAEGAEQMLARPKGPWFREGDSDVWVNIDGQRQTFELDADGLIIWPEPDCG